MRKQRIRLAVVATGISFMGTLPLGTLNLSVAHLMARHDLQGAAGFALAAAAVEILAVRVSLFFLDRLQRWRRYNTLFRLVSVAVLLAFSLAILLSASGREPSSPALSFTGENPVLAGLTLSILNPLHIPFWMGWAVVLKDRGILSSGRNTYNLFVAAIGIGTLMAFALYGLAGRVLIGYLGEGQGVLNWALGLGLLAIALTQLYKVASLPS